MLGLRGWRRVEGGERWGVEQGSLSNCVSFEGFTCIWVGDSDALDTAFRCLLLLWSVKIGS